MTYDLLRPAHLYRYLVNQSIRLFVHSFVLPIQPEKNNENYLHSRDWQQIFRMDGFYPQEQGQFIAEVIVLQKSFCFRLFFSYVAVGTFSNRWVRYIRYLPRWGFALSLSLHVSLPVEANSQSIYVAILACLYLP